MAINRPNDSLFHGQITLPVDFHNRVCSYEEFATAIHQTTPVCIINKCCQEIGTAENVVKIGYALIEQPTRHIVKHNGERQINPQLFAITRYWKRFLSECSPYLLVETIDAIKWQRKLLLNGNRETKIGISYYDRESLRVASVISGHYIRSPHTADALCLVKYKLDCIMLETCAS